MTHAETFQTQSEAGSSDDQVLERVLCFAGQILIGGTRLTNDEIHNLLPKPGDNEKLKSWLLETCYESECRFVFDDGSYAHLSPGANMLKDAGDSQLAKVASKAIEVALDALANYESSLPKAWGPVDLIEMAQCKMMWLFDELNPTDFRLSFYKRTGKSYPAKTREEAIEVLGTL